jgi:protein-S-isoprenylcysteine O-methyltransferase Ste14
LLFLLDCVWGLLVLIFNPAYTPFFFKRNSKILLATQGPYALIRHPRYASEAALNVILYLLTGAWIPLLGLFGWAALYLQALAEEKFLLAAAPETYGRYYAGTGRFLPRWKFRQAP